MMMVAVESSVMMPKRAGVSLLRRRRASTARRVLATPGSIARTPGIAVTVSLSEACPSLRVVVMEILDVYVNLKIAQSELVLAPFLYFRAGLISDLYEIARPYRR